MQAGIHRHHEVVAATRLQVFKRPRSKLPFFGVARQVLLFLSSCSPGDVGTTLVSAVVVRLLAR